MKTRNDILFLFGLIICSGLLTVILYNQYHADNIFQIFEYIGLGLIWVFCFYKILKSKRQKSKYPISIISVFTLVPLIIIFIYYQQKLNVPTLIEAQRHGVYADFKTDGTYIIKSGVWGSKTHFYGKYILRDSIIQIDKSNLDEVLISNRFLIKHANAEEEKRRPDYDRLHTENYLVQINKAGNEIKARGMSDELLPYKFEIVVDNRK